MLTRAERLRDEVERLGLSFSKFGGTAMSFKCLADCSVCMAPRGHGVENETEGLGHGQHHRSMVQSLRFIRLGIWGLSLGSGRGPGVRE